MTGSVGTIEYPRSELSTGTSRQPKHAMPFACDRVGEHLLDLRAYRLIRRQEKSCRHHTGPLRAIRCSAGQELCGKRRLESGSACLRRRQPWGQRQQRPDARDFSRIVKPSRIMSWLLTFFNICDKPNATSVMLIGRVIKPLTRGKAGAFGPRLQICCQIVLSASAFLFPSVAEPLPAKRPAPISKSSLGPYSHMSKKHSPACLGAI